VDPLIMWNVELEVAKWLLKGLFDLEAVGIIRYR
jgi:hypothetical protein